MSHPVNRTLKSLAQQCVDRCDTQERTKGKRRDEFAIEFFCGAAAALCEMKHEDANCVLTTLAYVITPRGFAEVARLADLGPCYNCESNHPGKCDYHQRREQKPEPTKLVIVAR